MFSEEPIRIWGESPEAPYEYLGRPMLKIPGQSNGSTIDFALKSKRDGRIYVAELKCELAFENYGYLVLTSCGQVQRHVNGQKEAFARFVTMARNPSAYEVTISDRAGKRGSLQANGAILVWGSVSEEGKKSVMEEFGFADVLSVEDAICDLLRTNNAQYLEYMEARKRWCLEMFEGVLGVTI